MEADFISLRVANHLDTKHLVQPIYLFYVYSPLVKGGQIEAGADLEGFSVERWGSRAKTSFSKVGQ